MMAPWTALRVNSLKSDHATRHRSTIDRGGGSLGSRSLPSDGSKPMQSSTGLIPAVIASIFSSRAFTWSPKTLNYACAWCRYSTKKQPYAKHASNATQVKIKWKAHTLKIFSDPLGLLVCLLLPHSQLHDGLPRKAKCHFQHYIS